MMSLDDITGDVLDDIITGYVTGLGLIADGTSLIEHFPKSCMSSFALGFVNKAVYALISNLGHNYLCNLLGITDIGTALCLR